MQDGSHYNMHTLTETDDGDYILQAIRRKGNCEL